MTKVGIDDLNVAAGSRSIDFEGLVAAGRHRATDLANVGFTRRSVLDVWEDPVTLAAAAAAPLIDDPNSIGLLLVGTESGLDFGKPLSSYLHEVLGLGPRCRNAEVKHACYGGTMGLRLACSWVREHPGRKALVVSTDICRRHQGPAELTAGIGAVAMTITANPRVLEIDVLSGTGAKETWDVARPTPTFEHGDAVLSLYSYLDLIEVAWEDLQESTGIELEDFAYLLYHCPLVSLVRQAHVALTGTSDDFAERVEPALGLNRELSNIYGGSLYASLLGLMEARDLEEGTRLGLFSYGSGACAELWTGRAGTDAAHVRKHNAASRLRARRPCSIEEWLAADAALETQLCARDFETHAPNQSAVVLERIDGWHRHYRSSV
jgi:3-hydroxy-3-methylglutaryl CoA synthase